MAPHRERAAGAATSGVAGPALAALAVVCCGAVPLIAAFAGTLALGALLGIGAGVLAIAAVAGGLLIRTRRSRSCIIPASRPDTVVDPAGLDRPA